MIPNQIRARTILDSFNKRFPPCMIFYGPRGSGQKELFEEYFAEAGEDRVCFDKPKVDELTPLTSWVNQKPVGDYRVVMIERTDDVSKEAMNFLLKIIEDSPSYVRWVLIADSKYDLLPPLLSRSFLVPFVAFSDSYVPELCGGNLQIKANIARLNTGFIDSQLAEVIESGGKYHKVYGFCNFLKANCEAVTKELEFLRDVYLYCCNYLMRHFKDEPEKLHHIQEAKNTLRENLRGEQSFKAMFLRLF